MREFLYLISESFFFAGLIGIASGFAWGKLWYFVTHSVLKTDGKQKVWGFHFHHSLFAIFPIVTILFVLDDLRLIIFLSGLALGIITEHRVSWGKFLFLEKLDKKRKVK